MRGHLISYNASKLLILTWVMQKNQFCDTTKSTWTGSSHTTDWSQGERLMIHQGNDSEDMSCKPKIPHYIWLHKVHLEHLCLLNNLGTDVLLCANVHYESDNTPGKKFCCENGSVVHNLKKIYTYYSGP